MPPPVEDAYPLSSSQEDILTQSGRHGKEYTLSPSQQGLLFHTLYAEEPGVYVQQLVCELREALDVGLFQRAWNHIIARHAALRTSLRCEGVEDPIQVVKGKGDIPVEEEDWSRLSAVDQDARLEMLLDMDRRRAFDLGNPPLMRLTLLRRGAAHWTCVWTYHHVLLDDWSQVFVLKEVFAFYDTRGQEKLPDRPPPYRDYIYWLRGQDWSSAQEYWRAALKGFRAPTPLLAVAPAPGTAFRADPPHGLRTFRLPADLTAALRDFARQHGLTLETLVQGAYAAVLSRYSGEEDVVFGATRPGRHFPIDGAEAMVGQFMNTLPVRARVSPDVTVLDLLKELHAQTLAVRPHEETPLLKVYEASEVPRGMPLFDSIFVCEDSALDDTLRALGGPWANRSFELREQTNYPLAVCAYAGERLLLRALFLRPRFDDGTIDRLFGHLQTLLEGMIAHPDERVAALPILTAAEHRQIVHEWNDTAADYPRDRCIHQLFEAQARRTPDAVAVVHDGRETTYRELNERANRLAHHLRGLGVKPGVLVGICIERSTDMIVGVLGITKAGGAYVPLDPAYPKDRLAFMLDDIQAPVLLTQRKLVERLPESKARVLCMEELAATLARARADDPVSGVTPGDLAYIIYTSGSTGKPKGVVLRHGPVVNLLDWVNTTYHVGPGDRVLFVTSLNFDLSVYDIFGILGAGATVRVASSADLRDPERLLEILCDEPITFWDSAPPQLAQLAPFFPSAQQAPRQKHLRLVFLSGDWIPVPLPDAIRATFPGAEVVSLGGATEAAIWSNSYPVGVVDPKWPSIPYGRPIRNARYHVLDKHLNPVPVGVPGELHIGGGCLADGYLNRPELTAEKFIPDPFAAPAPPCPPLPPGERGETGTDARQSFSHSDPAAPPSPLVGEGGRGGEGDPRLYRTGDLARYFPDGNLEFLGRLDFQVKIRGFRIELGEIETVLAQHPAVREGLVTALKDESGDRYLCGYVIARPGQQPTGAALREFLAAKLPAHMVPAHYVTLEAFPLNPNGKIDRKALPAPGRERRDEAAAYVAPRDPTEQAVAAIWAEVLGVERVGIHDDFFAMGGHSLTATRAVSRIRQQLRIDLPLPVFFQAPTVAKLCAGLPKGEAAGAVIQPADLPPGPDGKVRAPASFGQRRLWFLDQLGQDREVYNIVYQIRMTGPVDEPALRRALETLVERHATLRTTFADEGGQPVQVIAPPAPIELELLDLTALPPGERDADAAEVAAEEGRFVFDLAQGPLWRARLVRLAAEDHLLLWTMHHIVSDGWSMWVLVRELAAAYEALLANRPPTLPPLPLRYADFSQWQCGWLQGAVLEGQLGYWTKRLAGSLPVLQLPVSRTRPKTQTFRGAVHRFALPLDLAKALEEVSRHEGVTPYMALLAAFVGLLHRYSGQEDILVGTPIANRNRAETEGIVGLFINTLVLRTDVSGDLTLRELLARIRQGSLEAFAHQDLPFDLLVQAVKAERSASHQPLFQVLFNYLHGVTQDLTVGGGRWLAEQGHNGTAKFDLTLQMEETQQGLRGLFEYNTDLFDAPTVERLTGHFQVLLRGLLADLDRRLSQVLLLTDAERRQLLVQWNATRADYPRDRCTHQLVEEQAARTPDRVAVVFDNRQLTYGELNARANQLAHHLKTLGVGPETLVGLCVERSTDMVVGLLGILKAGGAYVPLDPDFPRDRLAFYLQDSAMPVLVTQRRLVTRLAGHRARTVCLDADAAALAAQRRDNLPATATPANLAYVIYTSGSTGKPKGVQVPQGALVNFLNAMRRRPGLTASDTLLAVTTLSFDIHALEVWLPLTVGAKVVVVSKDVAGDGVRLLERMTECAATVLQATPATWRLLLEAGWQGTRGLKALCGGEPMTVELAEKLLGRVEELWNMYGPTETTVWSTVHRVTSAGGPVPIGRPIDNTQIYLVDAHNNPVPVGVVGELLLGGDGVARGYLNRPELTAEKFVPDPFVAPAPPCPPPPRGGRGGTPRVYRTGDLARYLPDGNLECLGRVDHQVKVRGFRIELGEIETILGQHPAIQGNVVVARKDDAGADYLAAYVIPRPGQDATPDDLRRHLHAKLPDYMVPSYFVILEQFPLTPNGKIDRKALPAPQQGLASAGQAARAAVAPRDDAERELAQIWEDVLKVRPVGVTDNFFDLGGHSFLAAVLIARIRQQMGHALPLGMLFEAPTVEKLAAAMRQRLEAGTESSLVPLHEDGANPPLYMIAGVGGHVFTFHRFARLLGPDQPVYGVKAIGIDGTVAPPETVEAIAAHYVKEILAVRPKGPYLLSGYSIGAVVAFELALQLRALGHEVPGVVVFDMLAPGYPPKAALPKRLWMHFSTFLGLPMRAKKSYLGERLDKIWVRLLNWTGQGLRNAPEIQGVEGLQQGALKRVWLALSTAVNRYRPAQKFDGKVVLFKAEEGFHWAATIIDDPLYGWGQLTAGGVETHTVPGGHMEIFHDKNIDLVARGLMESVGALQKGR